MAIVFKSYLPTHFILKLLYFLFLRIKILALPSIVRIVGWNLLRRHLPTDPEHVRNRLKSKRNKALHWWNNVTKRKRGFNYKCNLSTNLYYANFGLTVGITKSTSRTIHELRTCIYYELTYKVVLIITFNS